MYPSMKRLATLASVLRKSCVGLLGFSSQLQNASFQHQLSNLRCLYCQRAVTLMAQSQALQVRSSVIGHQ